MGKKILLADDSITIQKVIELTFSDEDFEVVTVGNGRLAIERVAEVAPDVVLCDIIMPEKDGYEVCDFIKKHAALSHVPVLLLTGAFEPFDQERATRVGADGYLAKPFEPQTLISKVKELLERGPVPRAAAPAPAPVRHATVPVPSETSPMPAVRTPPPAPPPAAPAPAVADFEPLYAVEESPEFQPLETAGGFEPLESLESEPAGSPLDAFVSEPTFARPEPTSSATMAFIPEEPLVPRQPPEPQMIPAEVELAGEPELVAVAEAEAVFVAEPEPELMAEPEPELLAEPEPVPVAAAELAAPPEAEFGAEPEPELVAEPDLLVAEPEPAPAPPVEAVPPAEFEALAEPPVETTFEESAALVTEEVAPQAVAEVGEVEPAAVEFEAPTPAEVWNPTTATTSEIPLEERARAAVEAAYGAVFAADQPLAEEPAPEVVEAVPEGESVFEFEAASAPEAAAEPPSESTAELVTEDLVVPEEPAIAAQPSAPPVGEIEATFEEAFETPPPMAVAIEPPIETLEELDEALPSPWAAAPAPAAEAVEPVTAPAEEVSFDDVAPVAAAPAPAGAASVAAEVGVPVDMVAAIAQRVVGQLSEKVIREVAWEIIPELAEALIKKEIERLRAELDRLPK